MTPQTILYIIIAISVVSYLFGEFLDYINLKAQRTDIPDDIATFYDRTKYLKSLAYHKELSRFGFITSGFSFLLSMVMLIAGGFGWLDSILTPIIGNEILLALAFF